MNEALAEALQRELASCPLKDLQNAVDRMMLHYRNGKNSESLFSNSSACLAYLAVRLPATYAAIEAVFRECAKALPLWRPRSLLDIGAGPGTGGWAALEQFESIQTVTCIERNRLMRELGQKLAQSSSAAALRNASWIEGLDSSSADLVLLSYFVGEISASQRNSLIDSLWKMEVPLTVIIEPGTPAGFQRILEIRKKILSLGALIAAPCPHHKKCPLETKSWCHFPARVERSRLHLLLKHGSLGYEDEKFSYLAFGKMIPQSFLGRIVENPRKHGGFVQIPLCTEGEFKEIVVSKKQENYRTARKAEYGDAWSEV